MLGRYGKGWRLDIFHAVYVSDDEPSKNVQGNHVQGQFITASLNPIELFLGSVE